MNASEYGNQCVQFGSDDYLGTDTLYGDEDCLYINVFTPDVRIIKVLRWFGSVVLIFLGKRYRSSRFSVDLWGSFYLWKR